MEYVDNQAFILPSTHRMPQISNVDVLHTDVDIFFFRFHHVDSERQSEPGSSGIEGR